MGATHADRWSAIYRRVYSRAWPGGLSAGSSSNCQGISFPIWPPSMRCAAEPVGLAHQAQKGSAAPVLRIFRSGGFPMWLWAAFILFIFFLVALDLGIFHRNTRTIAFREALILSGVWIGV